MGKKVLILMDGSPFPEKFRECGSFDTEEEALTEAKYQIGRRLEKDGWTVERVVIGEDVDAETIQDWHDSYARECAKAHAAASEYEERRELERLTKKYGR